MSGKMDCFGLTRIGSRQPLNQDQFLIADLEKSMRLHASSLSLDDYSRLYGNSQAKLLLVSDGIGDSGTGDLASRLVTEHLTRYLLNDMPWSLPDDQELARELRQEFTTACQQCQARLNFDIQEHPERSGMEATLTLGYLTWPVLNVVHVGHSRCYLYRNSQLTQLTRDHNLTQRLVKSGALKSNELPEVWQEMPYNVIGGDPEGELQPQIMQTEIQVGDTLLLCTDGLTRQVSDASIADILSRDLMADETCIQLIHEAQERDGTDNMTVIVARFLDLGDQDVALSGGLKMESDRETITRPDNPQHRQKTPPEKQQP